MESSGPRTGGERWKRIAFTPVGGGRRRNMADWQASPDLTLTDLNSTRFQGLKGQTESNVSPPAWFRSHQLVDRVNDRLD